MTNRQFCSGLAVARAGILCLSGSLLAIAAPLSVRQSGFTANSEGLPSGWTTWSPRAEIAPRSFVDPAQYRLHPGSLAVSGNGNEAAYGGWEHAVQGIEPGSWYRFTAHYRARGVQFESLRILPRITWRSADGRGRDHTDFAYQSSLVDGWKRVTVEMQAPARASTAVLQLFLRNSAQGTVWWDEIIFEQIPAPAPRKVTIAAVNLRPDDKTPEKNVSEFVAAIDRVTPPKTDLIVLPEGITVVGTGRKYADVAETIPGPTTARLGEAAKRHASYLIAGLYEREGATIYNTAVLIDRQGQIAGKYRKVYVPFPELDSGLTPGNEYPVFRTDFGTVGIMICYDVFFPDPARALARQGAEILVLPIWGGDESLGKARAIDNRTFLVASGYDYPTYVMDPDGKRIATAPERGSAAITTIDLARPYIDPRLGDMKARRAKEFRADLVVP